MHLHKFEINVQAFYMLLLKYFIIIKKEEIVAPWIDFDDYKVFEGITNDLGLEKDLLHFRGKIIILSRSVSEASRARTEDVQYIGRNFNIFRSIFCKKIRFLFLSRPHESTHDQKGWTACENFGWHTLWIDPMSRPLGMSRSYE